MESISEDQPYLTVSDGVSPTDLSDSDLEPLEISNPSSLDGGPTLTPEVTAALQDLARCSTLECITDVHPRLSGSTKFNLPHFMITGWQKCATTSIYRHLTRHPEIAKPFVKEPHFFTACQRNGKACKVAGGNNTHAYIRDTFQVERVAASGLTLASMDASVDYAMMAETLAPKFKQLFPWIKLVFVMREGIGRAMSWKNMMQEKFQNGCGDNKAACLKGSLTKMNYSYPLSVWLEHFPADQILVMQFEALAIDPEPELRRMKQFLGLDPDQPSADLRNVNQRSGSSGWPIEKKGYDKLVKRSRADGEAVVSLLEKYNLGDGKTWMQRWEAKWEKNYESCDEKGICSIASS